jgi:hypothetical protein
MHHPSVNRRLDRSRMPAPRPAFPWDAVAVVACLVIMSAVVGWTFWRTW